MFLQSAAGLLERKKLRVIRLYSADVFKTQSLRKRPLGIKLKVGKKLRVIHLYKQRRYYHIFGSLSVNDSVSLRWYASTPAVLLPILFIATFYNNEIKFFLHLFILMKDCFSSENFKRNMYPKSCNLFLTIINKLWNIDYGAKLSNTTTTYETRS
ncbi:hypothetical protein RhiirC2_51507 [Rhizophagus irregularis]|uniref:Uncharacterized protein n=1 Tax=Rhizophagus irregularis TaxID=588596 RepID=A0A2N1MW30_9GLOM|nr:hypothetical protein RhiirC2_51507 [Rhizophagus irregularis]